MGGRRSREQKENGFFQGGVADVSWGRMRSVHAYRSLWRRAKDGSPDAWLYGGTGVWAGYHRQPLSSWDLFERCEESRVGAAKNSRPASGQEEGMFLNVA